MENVKNVERNNYPTNQITNKIMDYEKAYKEALERAKESLKDGTISSNTISYIEEIFPELKESEDERIRKWIIGVLSTYEHDRDLRNAAIAWLEKQGEKKPADKVEPKFYEGEWVVSPNGVYWHIDAIQNGRYQVSSDSGKCAEWPLDTNIYHRFTIQDAKDGDVLSYRDGQWIFIYKNYVDDNSFQYYTLYSTIHQDLTINDAGFTLLGDAITPATKEQRGLLFSKIKEAGYEWDTEKKKLKKIEQKPANKVKPKFKVGDWIIGRATNNEPRQISEITDQYYKSTYGGQYGFSFENEMHLWTIADAKDGDVLVDEDTNVIGIFESIEGMCWHSKFYYSNFTKEFYGIECGGYHLKEFAKPATKEQRDTLMKAMALILS